MKTINQLIDSLSAKAKENPHAAAKLRKLRQYKLKHPYSGKLLVRNTKDFAL